EYRVEVELGDFREVADERANVFDEARDLGTVDRRIAAHTVEDRRATNLAQHRKRLVGARRGQAEGRVSDRFDEYTTEAERGQLAEHRISHRSDDHFGAAGQHLLHDDATDVRPGDTLLDRG